MKSESDSRADSPQRIQKVLQKSALVVFAIVLTLGLTFILSFNLVRGPLISVTLGEPAPEEVIAPQSMTYVSDVLTERAQQQAAASVPDQFTPINLSTAREQNNQARAVLSFIEVVRADSMADLETRISYLQAIENLNIDEELAEDILSLSPSEFSPVSNNIVQIIENTMRQGVLEDQLSEAKLAAAQGAAFDLTPKQERVVTGLAPQFVVPNIFFDEEATLNLQTEKMAEVEPVPQRVTKDERIIRVGEIIQEEDIEMLGQLGLLQQETNWQIAVSSLLASMLAVSVITIYWNQYFGDRTDTSRSLTILAIMILLFVLIAKLLIPGGAIYAYLYPAAALSILVAVIFEARLALVVTAVVASLVGYIAQDSLEMAAYAAASGFLAVLTLHDTQRINALFRAGLFAAIAYAAVILVFRLPQDIAVTEILTLVSLGFLNGLISASLSLAGIFIIGTVFGVITMLQLQELSRLDHPLLEELLRRAPGTYHHSIMVANLAEQGAEKVRAKSTLVRVGAFYHDVGKMNRPPFFSENQNGGNPHDSLDPLSSARIILSHVPDGLELARRYRLPNRIRHFIAEHHGDRVVWSFYNKALALAAEDEEVDITRFQYSGPRPRSRETGIVQLADSIEATSRALRPSTEEEIEKIVTSLIEDHLKEGQLDDSGLTLGDIKVLRESFIKTLKGRYHMRVKYPGNEELMAPHPDEIPQLTEGAEPIEVPELVGGTDQLQVSKEAPLVERMSDDGSESDPALPSGAEEVTDEPFPGKDETLLR
jgi:putative nucleotidyltransferase with HDIG domain